MDFADEDGDRSRRGGLLADQIGTEAIVLLGAAFDELAECRQFLERDGVLWSRRGQRRVRRKASRGDQRAHDRSALSLSLRIKVEHLVPSCPEYALLLLRQKVCKPQEQGTSESAVVVIVPSPLAGEGYFSKGQQGSFFSGWVRGQLAARTPHPSFFVEILSSPLPQGERARDATPSFSDAVGLRFCHRPGRRRVSSTRIRRSSHG